MGRTIKILIEINISEETSIFKPILLKIAKSGIKITEVKGLVKEIIEKCPNIKFCGLMCMPKIGDLDAFKVNFFFLHNLENEYFSMRIKRNL